MFDDAAFRRTTDTIARMLGKGLLALGILAVAACFVAAMIWG
jgi:hypothetical protein